MFLDIYTFLFLDIYIIIGQHSFEAHAKLISLPLGVFRPDRLKKFLSSFASNGELRKTFVGDTALTRKPLRVKAASIVQAKIQGRMRTITPPSPAYVSKYGLIESKWYRHPLFGFAFLLFCAAASLWLLCCGW